MKKTITLLLAVTILTGSLSGSVLPVRAENSENTDNITESFEEIPQKPEEEPENTVFSDDTESSGQEAETSCWTLRYEPGEDVQYEDERDLEETVPVDDPEPVFTLYEFPAREGYTAEEWRIHPEDAPEHEITCSPGESLDPKQFYETGGVIIAEPVWLKLFTVTVIYEPDCEGAQLEEPYSGSGPVIFENQTRRSFDIRLNAWAEGKIFAGWSEDPSAGVLLNSEEAMQELADRIIEQNISELTLYGVWEDAEPQETGEPEEEKEYHVIYRASEDCVFADAETFEWEQGLYTKRSYPVNDEVVIDQEVTREGFILAGWALAPEGTVTYKNGDSPGRLFETLGEDLILYAVWEVPVRYTLRCYVNGGVIEDIPADKKGIASAKITASELDSLIITRNGYSFDGWFADSKFKTRVTAETFAENPKNMNLYAKWTAKTYRILFDLNDEEKEGAELIGIDPVSDETYDAVKEGLVFNKKQKLAPKAKAPGYTFLGWSRDPEAVSAKYKAGKSYKNYSPDGEDVTLYAVWKLKSYKLKIHVNGGKYTDVSSFSLDPVKIKDGIASPSYTVENTAPLQYVTIPLNNTGSEAEEPYASFFARPGYTFEGWYKDSKLKKPVESEDYFREPGNYTVYAKWAAVQYTVRLNVNAENAYLTDADGNQVSSLEKAVTYNKKTAITAVPVKEGYTFLGWSADPEAVSARYVKGKKYRSFSSAAPKTGDIVELYAVWKKKNGTIEPGLNDVTYSGVKLSVYEAPEGYRLEMLSAGEGRLKNIKDFSNPNLSIAAAVNANYFQMRQDTYDPYGTHYGVEQTYDGVDLAPKRSGLIAYYQTNDGEIGWMPSDQYYLSNSDVIFACTPYAVLRHHGQTVNVRSTALGNKENLSAYQTMILRVRGVWRLVVSRTQTTPNVMRKYAESVNAEEAILMDGGGSTQMVANVGGSFKDVRYTGRAIPNVLCIAREH